MTTTRPVLRMESLLRQPGLHLPEEWACGMRLHAPGAGLRLACLDVRASRPWECEAEGPPATSLCVLLEGRMETALRGGPMLRASGGMCVFMHGSGARNAGFHCMHAQQRLRLVEIRLTPQAARALRPALAAHLPGHPSAQEGEGGGAGSSLAAAHAPAALLRAARDILACPLPDGAARALWLRAKALEALAVFASQPPSPAAQAHCHAPVHAADLPRLRRAHALLQRHCGQPWTAAALAHEVGLNEKRLQAGFQHLYGQSVHARLTHWRMQTARALLAAGRPVAEVACAVGFASASHFGKTFLQHAGAAPKAWALASAQQDEREASRIGHLPA